MEQLEYTPSVCFNLDNTHNKRDMSEELIFELSCTNRKHPVQPPHHPHLIIDLDQQIALTNPTKLKTQDFFQQFDHNFVVTFDEECIPTDHFRQTAAFHQKSQPADDAKSLQMVATYEDELQKIDLCLQPKCSMPEPAKKSKKKQKSSLASAVKPNLKSASTKEKDSPIEFEVKKRTVFKSKQNIVNTQPFKITKKKIVSQETLDCLALKPKSCKSTRPKSTQNKKSFTSQLIATKSKKASADFPFDSLKIDTNRTSSIFVDHKQARQSFRSTTLDNWKRKFQMKKKGSEQSKKRSNIFHCALQLR